MATEPVINRRGQPLRPSPLTGERRQVTVIVSDVKGSSAIMEAIGSEAWVEEMNQVLQIMGAAIYQFGGEVNQFRGDGMVAFFGARSAHEDDPERAILAALVMQNQLHKYSKGFQDAFQQELLIRIGINTGEVITANIGNINTYSEDTAMGAAITLAARLETAANPGSILVSRNTYEQVSNLFNWESLGEIELRGLSLPVKVYQPISPLSESEQRHRLQAYGLSIPLIGRDSELSTIKKSIKGLRNDKGGIVLVRGEAGMGKSRLIFEAQQHVNRDEALKDKGSSRLAWLQGRCRSYDHSRPDSMWVDLWQRWLGMGLWVSQEEALKQLKIKGQQYWGDQFDEHFQYMAAFLSLPLDDFQAEHINKLDAESLRHRFFMAIYKWLDEMAQKEPLIIVFSEVHWADKTSLDLLRYCLPLSTREKILFIVVFRPEHSSPVWEFQHLIKIEYPNRTSIVDLEPLPVSKSNEFLNQMIGAGTLSTRLRKQIVSRAAGNPYYLTELVRSLVDKQILVRDNQNQGWRLVTEDVLLELPASLKSLLLARIDSLSPSERHTLQMAAVIGPIFWFEILKELKEDGLDLRKQLAIMQRGQMIKEHGLLPDLGREYVFSSTLIQEAAYESILSSQLAELHTTVAVFLERIVKANILRHYHGIIAYHFGQAGLCQRELFHTLLDAEDSKKIYANNEAIHAYQHVIDLLDRKGEWDCVPPEKMVEEWRLEALKGLGQIHFGIGEVFEAERFLREAVSLGRMINMEPLALARIFYWLGEVLFWQGRYEEPIHLGEEGLYQLGDNNQNTEAALMNQLVAVGSSQLGDHKKFIEFTMRTADFITTLPYSEELRPAFDHIIVLYAYTLKDLVQAQHWLDTFQEKAENNHDLRALGEVFNHTASISTRQGDLMTAIPYYKKAIDQFTRIGDAKHLSRVYRSLGICYLQLGLVDDARQCFDKAVETAGVYQNETDCALGYWYKAQVCMTQGKNIESQELFKKALEFSKNVTVLRDGWAFLGFGRVNMVQGSQQEVQDIFKFSLESNPTMVIRTPYQALSVLSKLERSYDQSAGFRSYVDSYRHRHKEVLGSPFSQWYLIPAETNNPGGSHLFHSMFEGNLKEFWQWIDPFGDCKYVQDNGVTIYASNERNFHHINRSAPRLLYQDTLSGDFTIQVRCSQGSENRPTIGGLVVWQSDQYWFCLEIGTRGPDEITLRGFLDNYDQVFGRGKLKSDQKLIRLERRGQTLSAYCTGDGKTWFFTGCAEISTPFPVSLGIHAIGHINRMVYPGVYSDGTSIKFEEFWMWDS